MKNNRSSTPATLATIDPKTGKPPPERITDASMAAQLANKLIDYDQERAIKRSQVQGLINGNPPIRESELKRTGQSGRCNISFREAEGHINAKKTTYFNLVLDVPCLVNVTMNDPKIRDRNYASVIAENFSKMLKEWPGFMYNIMLHQSVMTAYGIGPVYWPDKIDWKFKATQYGSFLVNSGATSSIDTLDVCVIRGSYKSHELFWKISATEQEISAGIDDAEKLKVAREEGWNPDLVRTMIVQANMQTTQRRDDQYSTSMWESIQQQIKNGDVLYANTQTEEIYVDHVFVREFRGGISHYIVPENYAITGDQYLFRSKNEYPDYTQIICPFFTDIGDGSYHSVKGLGVKIFGLCAINDRLKNAMVDGAIAKTSIVVQGDVAAVRNLRVGSTTIIPSGVNVLKDVFNPDLQGVLEVSGFLEQSLAKNVGTNRPDLDDHNKHDPDTALGERLRLSREGKLERTDIMLYYQQLNYLYKEIKRRALNPDLMEGDPGYEEVKKFKDRCKARNVPEEVLRDDAFELKAMQAIGFGSPALARETTDEYVSVAAHFPEAGKVNAVRDYVFVRGGMDAVERYVPEDTTASDPSNQSSFAVLENSIMETGGEVLVGKDQFHLAHLAEHFKPVMQIAHQFVSTGGVGDNPLKAHDFMLEDLRHIAGHLDAIAQDPTRKPEYKMYLSQYHELLKVFSALTKMARKLSQDLQGQREQQQQAEMQKLQGENTGKAVAELARVQADFALAQQKEKNMDAVRNRKTDALIANKEKLTNHQIILDARKELAR